MFGFDILSIILYGFTLPIQAWFCWRICKKFGFPGQLGLLSLFPGGMFLLLLAWALFDWMPNSRIKISLSQLITLTLGMIGFQIFGGIAYFSSLFVADASSADRLPLWLTISQIPVYFAIFTVLQVIGIRFHRAYKFASLLSVLTLTAVTIEREYLGFLGKPIVFSFYGSVIILGILSFYISLNTRIKEHELIP